MALTPDLTPSTLLSIYPRTNELIYAVVYSGLNCDGDNILACNNGTLAMGWGSGAATFPYLVTVCLGTSGFSCGFYINVQYLLLFSPTTALRTVRVMILKLCTLLTAGTRMLLRILPRTPMSLLCVQIQTRVKQSLLMATLATETILRFGITETNWYVFLQAYVIATYMTTNRL